MAISVESMREHTAELAAGIVRLREWLGSLAEDQVAQLLTVFRSEVRRMALALAFALATAFFVCAAAVLVVFSLIVALWGSHRVVAIASAAAICALLAVCSVRGLRYATRACVRGRVDR